MYKNYEDNIKDAFENINYKDLVKFVLNNKSMVNLVLSCDERDQDKLRTLIKEDNNEQKIFKHAY